MLLRTVQTVLQLLNAHLGGAVLGVVVLLVVVAAVLLVLLVLGVLLARQRLGDQQGEDGHQDGVEQLLFQDRLEEKSMTRLLIGCKSGQRLRSFIRVRE